MSAPATSSVLALSVHLQKRFPSGFALDVKFTVPPGINILFGASGAGKTTLLDCLAGLLVPDAGHIARGAHVLFDSAQHVNVPSAKRDIGYVFQDLALFPHMSVMQNVEYGLTGVGAAGRRQRVNTILRSFHIRELHVRRPGQISGGERQRAALARALVTEPGLLLLDEPLAALDAAAKSRIIADLRAWNEERRIPILYVTHSRDEVFALGERVIALEGGRVSAEGTPYEVIAAPQQETMAQLAGIENIFDVNVIARHETQGTMTCGISDCRLEVPLGDARPGDAVRVGIRAGDILLATVEPQGLSARNVLPGIITALEQRDVTVIANVDCGIRLEVHVTPAARDALNFAPGTRVWAVIKTHSCYLLR